MLINKNFQETIRKDQTKTVQTTKSENKEYRYDAKEKGNQSYTGSKSKKKEKEKVDQKESKKPGKSGGIDILI
jgi:hypothetical protein